MGEKPKWPLSAIIETVSLYLFPVCLISSGFVNIILYFLGLHKNDQVRTIVSIIILTIILFIFLARLIFIFIECKTKRKQILISFSAVAFLILAYGLAFARFGPQYDILISFLSFGIYGVPIVSFAMDIAINRKEQDFLRIFELYALLLILPILWYIIFCVSGMNQSSNGRDLGALSYQDIAYMVMPLIFALMINGLYNTKIADSLCGIIKSKHANTIRMVMASVFWSAIVISTTRGAILSIGFFIFVMFIFSIKSKIAIRRLSVYLIIFTALFVGIVNLPQVNMGRIFDVVYSLKDGKLSTNSTSKMLTEHKDEIKALTPEFGAKKYLKKLKTENPDLELTEDEQGNVILCWDRQDLYRFALEEFKVHPLLGMGPLAFTMKYGVYPHNVLLELLCEWGILVFIAVVSLIIFLVYKLWKLSQSIPEIGWILLLSLGYVPQIMLSGSIYSANILLYSIVYSLTYLGREKKA